MMDRDAVHGRAGDAQTGRLASASNISSLSQVDANPCSKPIFRSCCSASRLANFSAVVMMVSLSSVRNVKCGRVSKAASYWCRLVRH